MKKALGWNPGKVCFGISRIGYSAASAICDILDNSVSNGAKKCWIQINKKEDSFGDAKAENIKEILIIDDGNGMDESGLIKALDLGSSDENYVDGTLSKFGLGLKSASFSQGKRLEVITACEGQDFIKAVVDLDLIQDEYFCEIEELQNDDIDLIHQYGLIHGTIIRISKIRENNHATISNIREKMVTKSNKCTKNLGVIYYYFLLEGLEIWFQGESIEPFDVLFEEEAEKNGNLNEDSWDGVSTKWVEKNKNILVDPESGSDVSITVSVVELPYPKLFNFFDEMTRIEAINKYGIGAGNYGFYIYRNKRLISWADGLDGMIVPDTSLYGFRGRILITDKADEFFNIDVKKERIEIAGELGEDIQRKVNRYTQKCKDAWEHASNLYKDKSRRDTSQITNSVVGSGDISSDLSCEGINTPEEAAERSVKLDELAETYRKEAIEETKQRLLDEGLREEEVDNPTEQQIEETIKGDDSQGRVFKRPFLKDNVLLAPYYDKDKGNAVRINMNHGFADRIYRKNKDDVSLQVHFEMLAVALAEAEDRIKANPEYSSKTIVDKIMTEYRIYVSDILGRICRENESIIPPVKDDLYE